MTHRQAEKRRRSALRTSAEWVSLAISSLLLAGVVVYLIRAALQPRLLHQLAVAEPRLTEARQLGEVWVLPVEIRNPGDRTLRNLVVEVTHRGAGGEEEKQELTLDYLGERSKTQVFVYVEDDPAGLDFKAQPLNYQVE